MPTREKLREILNDWFGTSIYTSSSVIDAIEALYEPKQEVKSDFSSQYTPEDEIKRLRVIQYELLECLVDVINQSCQTKVENDKFYIDNLALSAYEDAFYLLERFGIVKHSLGRKYFIDWEALEKQNPSIKGAK